MSKKISLSQIISAANDQIEERRRFQTDPTYGQSDRRKARRQQSNNDFFKRKDK